MFTLKEIISKYDGVLYPFIKINCCVLRDETTPVTNNANTVHVFFLNI